MTNDELTDANAAAYYAQIQTMRINADYHERRLIRFLRYEAIGCACRPDGKPGHTWSHVAELTAANLGSRQAAQRKWSRLVAADRRKPGEPGRGGRRRDGTTAVRHDGLTV